MERAPVERFKLGIRAADVVDAIRRGAVISVKAGPATILDRHRFSSGQRKRTDGVALKYAALDRDVSICAERAGVDRHVARQDVVVAERQRAGAILDQAAAASNAVNVADRRVTGAGDGQQVTDVGDAAIDGQQIAGVVRPRLRAGEDNQCTDGIGPRRSIDRDAAGAEGKRVGLGNRNRARAVEDQAPGKLGTVEVDGLRRVDRGGVKDGKVGSAGYCNRIGNRAIGHLRPRPDSVPTRTGSIPEDVRRRGNIWRERRHDAQCHEKSAA